MLVGALEGSNIEVCFANCYQLYDFLMDVSILITSSLSLFLFVLTFTLPQLTPFFCGEAGTTGEFLGNNKLPFACDNDESNNAET